MKKYIIALCALFAGVGGTQSNAAVHHGLYATSGALTLGTLASIIEMLATKNNRAGVALALKRAFSRAARAQQLTDAQRKQLRAAKIRLGIAAGLAGGAVLAGAGGLGVQKWAERNAAKAGAGGAEDKPKNVYESGSYDQHEERRAAFMNSTNRTGQIVVIATIKPSQPETMNIDDAKSFLGAIAARHPEVAFVICNADEDGRFEQSCPGYPCFEIIKNTKSNLFPAAEVLVQILGTDRGGWPSIVKIDGKIAYLEENDRLLGQGCESSVA